MEIPEETEGQRAQESWKDWPLALAHVWHCFVPSPSSSPPVCRLDVVWEPLAAGLSPLDEGVFVFELFLAINVTTGAWAKTFSAGFILYASIFSIFFSPLRSSSTPARFASSASFKRLSTSAIANRREEHLGSFPLIYFLFLLLFIAIWGNQRSAWALPRCTSGVRWGALLTVQPEKIHVKTVCIIAGCCRRASWKSYDCEPR